jgi:CRISPR-associated exonuclease Cas4
MEVTQFRDRLGDLSLLHYTGTQVNYYLVCKRKLWFFSNHIELESESDAVLLGKVIHESAYQREHKEIELDNIKLDWFDAQRNVIHEVKKSDSMEKAHEAQVSYYIYYLEKMGIKGVKGEIDYPKLKKRVEVELTEDKVVEIEEALKKIDEIVHLGVPPPIEVRKSTCKKCSYFQLCYS